MSVGLVLGLVLTACAPASRAARRIGLPGHWARFRYAAGVVDLAGPRGDGSFTVAAAGHLSLLSRTGALRPFARGPGGYSTATGPEPYKHPGTNSILRLRGLDLVKAGIRPGDLLAATEASARTIAVRCASTCTVKDIAVGPAISHAEGHIVFTRPG